jgi:8-oxo-dGTP diphosphatase
MHDIMKHEFSAGGVVYRVTKQGLEVLLAQHSQHHGWVFPKGLIGDTKAGEGREETALREVKEETGAEGEIIKTLSPVTYFYSFQGQKIKKTVYYFIMKFIGGDITKHDFEMEDVQWIHETNVSDKLTYKGDKEVWKEAQQELRTLLVQG